MYKSKYLEKVRAKDKPESVFQRQFTEYVNTRYPLESPEVSKPINSAQIYRRPFEVKPGGIIRVSDPRDIQAFTACSAVTE